MNQSEEKSEMPTHCHCCGHGRIHEKTATKAYYCPMCEGVESDKPGDCPKCGMSLEKNPAYRAKTIWTCPMHPEVQQDEPGECPKCGMDLEPSVPEEDSGENEDIRQMRRRFWSALAFTVPVFGLAMGDMVPGVDMHHWIGQSANAWIQFLLTTPVIFWSGWFVFKRFYRSMISLQPNMWTLIGLGTATAYGFSLVALLFGNRFPESLKSHGAVPLYFESAAVILTLVILGQYLEAKARGRTGDALKKLMEQGSKMARRIVDGKEEEVSVESVKVGDLLRVKPSEKVPVDGEIVEGSTRIDESMLTGESEPVKRGEGDAVVGGTLNRSGSFKMKATKVGDETALARIIDLVAKAQRSRAPIQAVADKVAGYFVPAVVLVAMVSFVSWATFGPDPKWVYALLNAVAVLIIACPCALGLATPISVMVGVGRGTQDGVLIRDAETLERIEKIDTVVLDKTGTVTIGQPRVVAASLKVEDESAFWRRVASVENESEHPLGEAILAKAKSLDFEMASVNQFEAISGAGVKGKVDGVSVLVGKSGFLKDNGISGLDDLEKSAEEQEAQGKTVVFVGFNDQAAGWIAIADPIRETSPEAIRSFHDLGLEVYLLTGDNEGTARAVAKELKMDRYWSQIDPEGKHEIIKKLKNEGKKVLMIGDGMNDAPALAAADVGVAMGSGTDVAMESAGITLVRSDLRSVVKAVHLGRATLRNIRQNLFFAFVYNGFGVPIAAGLLYPFFGLLLSPMIAAGAMSLSSVSVIGNALRLKNIRF